MKTLHIVNVFANDSKIVTEPFVRGQIQSLRQQGIEVAVFNVHGNESKTNYFKALFNLRKIMKAKRYDLVHGHYVYSGVIAASQRQVPSLVSFMGSDLNGAPKADGSLQLRGYADIALSHLLEYFVDGVIVKTNRMLDRLQRPHRAILLPNGVDFEAFCPMDQFEVRKQIGIDENPTKKYVLFVGGPSSPVNKGYAIALETVRELKRRAFSIELLCVEGVPHDQVPNYMNAADVMLFPSLQEGSPNAIKEAMACNLPIVSTDVGDVRDHFQAEPGHKVVDRDIQALAAGIAEILSQRKRTNGRKLIEHLKIENVAEKLIRFYEKLISEKQPRR